MKRKIAVGLVAVAAVNIVGGALVANAGSPTAGTEGTTVQVGTKTTLGYSSKSFHGKLTVNAPLDPEVEGMDLNYPSARDKYTEAVAACEQGRNVTVRKNKRGKDPKVGRSDSNAFGAWKSKEPRARGRYYAKVSSAKVEALLAEYGVLVKCGPKTSRTQRVGR